MISKFCFIFAYLSSFVAVSIPINENKIITFAGVKFKHPISNSLEAMGVIEPTPIQQAAIAPLTSGLTAILHAETGSGKTLAFLLPLLKRIINDENFIDCPKVQALIISPTKELAVQIAVDIESLLPGYLTINNTPLVHVCISSRPRENGLDDINSPILIGTPIKLLDELRRSSKETLDNLQVRYCVIDEVDRALSIKGKYAANILQADPKKSLENPTEVLLTALAKSQPKEGMQVVAASATVGRPLRRELYRILQGGEGYGEVQVIRPLDVNPDDPSGPQSGSTRKVGIPKSIQHIALVCEGENEFTSKLATAKELWVKESLISRSCLFVPTAEDVSKALGILRFWGIKEVKNLQEALGIISEGVKSPIKINSDNNVNSKSNKPVLSRKERRAREFGPPTGVPKGKSNDKLMNDKSIDEKDKSSSGDDDLSTKLDNEIKEQKLRSVSAELISRASKSKLGSSANFENNSGILSSEKELYVIPISGSRGLHLKDIENVLILSPPKTMNEYIHMAGRTGREGKKGKVYTIATIEEFKRLQSWQTALDIEFNVQYV